jgi:hypothetical protein
VSSSEPITYASEHGATAGELRYVESLPAAVFTSEEGLRGVFSELTPEEIAEADPEAVAIGADGVSS